MTEYNRSEAVAKAQQDFFERWWAEDYSWEGLAKKRISASVTLQDVWRHQAERLVEFAGKRWTTAHLPLLSLEGKPSGKKTWVNHEVNAFEHSIAQCVSMMGTPDTVRFLEGLVVATPLNIRALGSAARVGFRNCVFVDELVFSNVAWPIGTEIDQCLFLKAASFGGLKTNGSIKINRSNFCDGLTFEHAHLSGALSVAASEVFGDCNFKRAALGSVELSDCRLSAMSADGCTFGSALKMRKVEVDLSLTMAGASFGSTLELRDVAVGDRLDVAGGNARSLTTLDGVVAKKGIDSRHRQFYGEAQFRNCVAGQSTFSQATFHRDVLFDITYEGPSDFSGTIFKGNAFFAPKRFAHSLSAEAATFEKEVVFESSHFDQVCIFRDARFNGPRTSFQGSIFNEGADFQSKSHAIEGAFSCRGADFGRDVDFLGRTFKGQTSFEGVTFGGLPLFHDAVLHSDVSFRGARLNSRRAIQGGHPIWRRALVHVTSLSALGIGELREARNSAAERFETAFQRLRQHCAEHSHVDDELLFYEAQMRVRRLRTDVPIAERALSWLFDAFGGYGRYVSQPLILLLAIWGGFAAGFAGYVQSSYPRAHSWEVVGYVAQLFFAPPIFWLGKARREDAPEWARAIYDGQPGTLELLSVLGFVVTVSLLGLFFVSLRRRFALH